MIDMGPTGRKLLTVAGAVSVAVGFFVAGTAMTPTQDEPFYVGGELCAECHVDQAELFEGTTHDNILAFLADEPDGVGGCESCHGPGSLHVEMAGGEEPGFLAAINASPDPGSCTTCHVDQIAQFSLPERHDVLEGFMACSDCHNPHGSFNASFVSEAGNEACLTCHTEKEGPFVFPHAAQEVEGCVACHQPHGSVNNHLLPYRETQFTCLSCHVDVPSFHRLPDFADCVSCHSQIHGSNLHPAFLE
jgi:predicted CXXCH cytochrome family protein